MMPMIERIKPAMAKPLGALNIPINENSSPNAHTIMSTTGTQLTRNANKASTKPAVPNPFDLLPWTITVVEEFWVEPDITGWGLGCWYTPAEYAGCCAGCWTNFCWRGGMALAICCLWGGDFNGFPQEEQKAEPGWMGDPQYLQNAGTGWEDFGVRLSWDWTSASLLNASLITYRFIIAVCNPLSGFIGISIYFGTRTKKVWVAVPVARPHSSRRLALPTSQRKSNAEAHTRICNYITCTRTRTIKLCVWTQYRLSQQLHTPKASTAALLSDWFKFARLWWVKEQSALVDTFLSM